MRIARLLGCVTLVAGLGACAAVRVVHEHRNAPSAAASKTVVVQPGDTLYGIATRSGVKASDLAAWNGLAAPYTIRPGQHLQVVSPGSTTAPTATTARVVDDAPVVSAPLATPASPAKPTAAVKPSEGTAATAKPRNVTGSWQWPADGTLLARKSGAVLGIDIAGSAGASVHATAAGVVLYSGAGSPGYEELIVIRHDGDWVSSYAHNRQRLVGEGQRIKAGDKIAEMGRTGVQRDQVHFEMRHNGDLVDPLKYLPKR